MSHPITTEEIVIVEIDATTKEQAVRQLAERLLAAGRLTGLDEYLAAVAAREEHFPTGIEGGVAIPHAQSDLVTIPSVAVATTSKGIDFGADDGASHLIFLIAAPASGENTHLEILGSLARKIMHEEFRDRLRAEIVASGEDPDARLRRYVELTNACIAKRKPETAIGIHVCRGNSRSGWIAEGGYQRIADTVLGGLKVDHFLLEYDDERSGDFEPLNAVPRGVKVVLGLVTTKFPRLESAEDLVRRIEEASKYIPLEDLAISPQCGFASTVEGNIITPDDQWRKLDRIIEVSRRVWGDQ